jgi:hypothetical protein
MPSPNFLNHTNGVTWAIKNGYTFDEAIHVLNIEIERIKKEINKGG